MLRHLVNKTMFRGKICRWFLLFQEYEFEVIVKPRKLNLGSKNLSHILSGEDAGNLGDNMPDADLFTVQMVDDYFSYIVHFLTSWVAPINFTVA
jgi:hypothetical protein